MNKTDQILTDLSSAPGNVLIVLDNSPLWPQIARLAFKGVVEVVRTPGKVAAVRLLLSDHKAIQQRRNAQEELALDDLSNGGGSGYLGAHYSYWNALKRLESIGIVRREFRQGKHPNGKAWADYYVEAVGVDYFDKPAKSKLHRLKG